MNDLSTIDLGILISRNQSKSLLFCKLINTHKYTIQLQQASCLLSSRTMTCIISRSLLPLYCCGRPGTNKFASWSLVSSVHRDKDMKKWESLDRNSRASVISSSVSSEIVRGEIFRGLRGWGDVEGWGNVEGEGDWGGGDEGLMGCWGRRIAGINRMSEWVVVVELSFEVRTKVPLRK